MCSAEPQALYKFAHGMYNVNKSLQVINMKTITSFATLSAIVASMYHAPMTTLLIAIATVFALDLFNQYCNRRQQAVAQGNAAYDQIKDLFQASDDIMDKPMYQEPSDVWSTTEPTSCELACTVSFAVQPVLALPAGVDVIVEDVIVIDYSEFSYRELQAKVKALRTDKSIKLNAKKSVLVAWLQANA